MVSCEVVVVCGVLSRCGCVLWRVVSCHAVVMWWRVVVWWRVVACQGERRCVCVWRCRGDEFVTRLSECVLACVVVLWCCVGGGVAGWRDRNNMVGVWRAA